jgi:ElaB/YqjD/DUF883 family membrane-anchored ribosome-binding protein
MDQSSEMSAHEMSAIRHQMDETRSALTDKLERLEQKVTDSVQGTVQTVTDTVQGTVQSVGSTVENVRHAVEDTVNSVKTSVRDTVHAVGEAMSISHHVERHPWAMVAGATAVGFIGGYLLMKPSENARADEKFRHLAASQGRVPETRLPPNQSFNAEPVTRSATRETMSDMRGGQHTISFPDWLKPAATQVQSLAVGAALGLMRDMLVRSVPKPMTAQVTEIVDGLTTSLGGQVFRGSLLDQLPTQKS